MNDENKKDKCKLTKEDEHKLESRRYRKYSLYTAMIGCVLVIGMICVKCFTEVEPGGVLDNAPMMILILEMIITGRLDLRAVYAERQYYEEKLKKAYAEIEDLKKDKAKEPAER